MLRPALLASLLVLTRLPAAEVNFKFADARQIAVSDVAVSLVSLDGSAAAPATAPKDPVVIAQEKQEFLPYVSVVAVGTTVNFPNRDTVKHHVYSSSKAKKFELPLYAGEAREAVRFDQPGVVTLGCNIHDWMLAYVVVVATPWFTKAEPDGTARINVPPGRYRAEVWHPRLASVVTRELTIGDAAPAAQSFTLELGRDRRIRRNPDVKGGGYK
jgi:plastocyanin